MPQVWPENTTFVYLGAQPMQIPLSLEQRNQMRQYHIGPAGRSLMDPAYRQIDYAYTAQGMRAMAPCHLRCDLGLDQVSIHWTRRGRLDADRWDGEDIPLEYLLERYRVLVKRGDATLYDTTVDQAQISWDRPTWDGLLGGQGTQNVVIEVAQRDPALGDGFFACLNLG